MNFSYLSDVITALQPILTRALPLIGTSLVLWFFIKLKN